MYTTDGADRQSFPSRPLAAALDYLRRGMSVIPIRAGTKKPACEWAHYQSVRADEEQIAAWFTDSSHGVGIVCGDISGGLIVRDFDELAAYERWAASHPDLAKLLPTAATSRGRHVYARSTGAERTSHLEDGELRGNGGYVVAPPTVHPKGVPYRWIVPPNGPLPTIDLAEAGFWQPRRVTERTECTERTEPTERTEAMASVGSVNSVHSVDSVVSVDSVLSVTRDPAIDRAVERAIRDTLPETEGQRNRQIFEFARALKSVAAFADADPRDLEVYVRRWHQLALPVITTRPFEETFIDFLRAWKRVKFPKGQEPVRLAFEVARVAGPPEFAIRRYEQEGLRLLVALCRELQAFAGDGPFFLSCRTAGELLGVPHVCAWRWLYLLEEDQVIRVVERGSHSKRRATRYRYLRPIEHPRPPGDAERSPGSAADGRP